MRTPAGFIVLVRGEDRDAIVEGRGLHPDDAVAAASAFTALADLGALPWSTWTHCLAALGTRLRGMTPESPLIGAFRLFADDLPSGTTAARPPDVRAECGWYAARARRDPGVYYEARWVCGRAVAVVGIGAANRGSTITVRATRAGDLVPALARQLRRPWGAARNGVPPDGVLRGLPPLRVRYLADVWRLPAHDEPLPNAWPSAPVAVR